MKSGEDFRQAMGQADDRFVRIITQALNDLQVPRKKHGVRRRGVVSMPGRQERVPAVLPRDA